MLFFCGLMFFVVSIGALTYVHYQIKPQIGRIVTEKVNPKLAEKSFGQIKDLKLNFAWGALFRGSLSNLFIVYEYGDYLIQANGPIRVGLEHWSVRTFATDLQLTATLPQFNESKRFALTVEGKLPYSMQSLESATFHISSEDEFAYPPGVLRGVNGRVQIINNQINGSFDFKSTGVEVAGISSNFGDLNISFSGRTDDCMGTVQLVPGSSEVSYPEYNAGIGGISVDVNVDSCKSGEAKIKLSDVTYLDGEDEGLLSELNLHVIAQKEEQSKVRMTLVTATSSAESMVGDWYQEWPLDRLVAQLSATYDLESKVASDLGIQVDFGNKTSVIASANSWPELDEIKTKGNLVVEDVLLFVPEGASWLEEGKNLAGRVAWDLVLDLNQEGLWGPRSGSTFDIEEIDILWKERQIGVEDFSLALEMDSATLGRAEIALKRSLYQNLETTIKPSPLIFDFDMKTGISLQAPYLAISSNPIQLYTKQLTFAASWEDKVTWTTVLPVEMRSTDMADLLSAFCLPANMIPPMKVTAKFDPIIATQKKLLMNGGVQAKLFGGDINAGEIAIYNFLSAAPETQWSVDWGGIRLKEIAEFYRFGEIDGILEGHFKDAVMIESILTQYDFYFAGLPRVGKELVFSGKAMRNLNVLLGVDFDNMGEIPLGITSVPMGPIVDWVNFGFPRDVVGGFNVEYVGVKAKAELGFINIETLDPPERVALNNERYLLYGPSIKLPIVGSDPKRPIVMDAETFRRYLITLSQSLARIAFENGEQQSHDKPVETEQESNASKPETEETKNENQLACFDW